MLLAIIKFITTRDKNNITILAVRTRATGKPALKNFLSKCRYRSVSRLNAVRHNKRLLVAWIAGSGAREMEALSENEVMTECWKILKMVTDREDLPIPQRIIRSVSA